ncbi:uncharacterized protein BJ212DRAFT_1303502 [Suillus subaureus]|uniref:Uncharacterized protein n=1 Tax=Suillus subaureus TaxID=48587 RepID=A0A9P7J7X3_9AGAM|nr:uncharacterized protein BJ212DRAFT_1303502 [Suillus subaureus]KAG1807277.1 hypothetical protein BJ212DRAFT_1303502 [Suillus subaureus]
MSAARAEWNRLANNIPALEERSSDKDEHLAPSGGASVAPFASTFSRTGTGVGKGPERSSVKTSPQRGIVREATSTTNTMTRRAKPNEEWTIHPDMVTRTVIGPPEFFYSKDSSFYFSETRGTISTMLPSIQDVFCAWMGTMWNKPRSFSGSILNRTPMHNPFLPWDYEVEFLNAITFGANERIRDFRNTPFPFVDRHDLKDRQESTENAVIPAIVWHIARVMTEVEKSRMRYHWGIPEDRIYRNVAIPESSFRRLSDLATIWGSFHVSDAATRDKSQRGRLPPRFSEVSAVHLATFSSLNMTTDSNLLATVFVSANVAFLAVPGIDALQKTASLASSLFAMMSITVGVHHVWRHRGKVDALYQDAASVISNSILLMDY